MKRAIGKVQPKLEAATKRVSRIKVDVAAAQPFRGSIKNLIVGFIRCEQYDRELLARLPGGYFNVDPGRFPGFKTNALALNAPSAHTGNNHRFVIDPAGGNTGVVHIGLYNLGGRTDHSQMASIKKKATMAEFSHNFEIVRNKQDRRSAANYLFHALNALLLKDVVSHTEYFVDDQDVRIHMGCH